MTMSVFCAYIFDFDGVLVNTMEVHFACYKQALEEVGVPIDKKQFYYQAGMTGREQIQYFCEKAGKRPTPEEIDAIYKRKGEISQNRLDLVKPVDCNISLLHMLRRSGIPAAIASGSSKPSIVPVMKRFGIEADAVVSAEDVKRGKPNPDLFLCAAERLGVKPEGCIVVEDSEAGIEAAKRAGMNALRFFDNRGTGQGA